MANKALLADHERTIRASGSIDAMSRSDLLHWLADNTPSMFCGKPATVYFIGCTKFGIKIGTGTNIEARFREIQSCCPIRLSLLAQRAGGIDRESAYHAQFAEHRLHGEWFAPHADVLAEIARLGGEA